MSTAIPLSPGAGTGPARIGAVHLRVSDVDRLVDFYTGPVGLELGSRTADRAVLGAGDAGFLVLHADASAEPAGRGLPGLFHTAFLVPSRVELGRSLARLIDAQVRMTGFSDHLVSEAIYLDDPEGNGIEIYRDRPREEWPLKNGHIRMATDPLDLDGVLSGAGSGRPTPGQVDPATVVGHVHLRVADAGAAERFWREVVGLDVMARYPGASFLAADGYHHQLGINHWGSAGAPAPRVGARGLDHFELVVDDVDGVVARAGAADGDLVVDPSGNRVRIVGGG